jgi:GPH family glycoside/pentoside/hexuronide:cation symporter
MAAVGQENVPGPLAARVRYGYSMGNFGKSLQHSTIDLLYLFYLIQFIRTPPQLAGGALFAATMLDCVTGLAIGHFIDQRGAAGVSYRKLMAFGCLASAITFPIMFVAPLYAPSSAFGWAICLFLAFRVSANFLDVPHNALLAALTRSSRERGRLSTLRFFFSSLGNLAVSGLIALFLPRQGGGIAGLTAYVGVVTLLYGVTMATSVAAIRAARQTAPPQPINVASLRHAVKNIARNGRFVRVLLLCVLAACVLTIFPRMAVFYAQCFLGDASRASALVSAQIVGQIVSLPLWSWLQDRLPAEKVSMAAYGGFGALMALFLLLTPSTLWLAATLFGLAGVGLCGFTVMNWRMAPDAIEHTELLAGERHEALTFGLLLTAIKMATGAGAALLGLSLKLSGYPPSATPGGTQLPGLVAAMTMLPLIGAVACLLIVAGLRRRHAAD